MSRRLGGLNALGMIRQIVSDTCDFALVFTFNHDAQQWLCSRGPGQTMGMAVFADVFIEVTGLSKTNFPWPTCLAPSPAHFF